MSTRVVDSGQGLGCVGPHCVSSREEVEDEKKPARLTAVKDPAGELTGSMSRLDPCGDRKCRGSEGKRGGSIARCALVEGGARKKKRTLEGVGSRDPPELPGGERGPPGLSVSGSDAKLICYWRRRKR